MFRAGPHFWAQTARSSISKVPQFPAPKTGSPKNPTCIDLICLFCLFNLELQKASNPKDMWKKKCKQLTMKLQDFLPLYLSKFQKFTLSQTTSCNHFPLYQNLQLDSFPNVLLWLGRFECGHLTMIVWKALLESFSANCALYVGGYLYLLLNGQNLQFHQPALMYLFISLSSQRVIVSCIPCCSSYVDTGKWCGCMHAVCCFKMPVHTKVSKVCSIVTLQGFATEIVKHTCLLIVG